MNSVRLSICIVLYKNYEDAKSLLPTIEKYTDSKLTKKIYIVDNSATVVEKYIVDSFKAYIKDMHNVEYIASSNNLGFGKAHNRVLSFLNSDYHAIINPDILLCEDTFSSIVNWMNENSDIGMVIPRIVNKNGEMQKVYRNEITLFDLINRMFFNEIFLKRANKHTMQNQDYSTPFQVPFGQGSFLVIRTVLFKKLGGFDENFFMYVEDADLCKRVNQISKLMYYPDTKVIHTWAKGSHKDLTLFKYHVRSITYYFKKWGWKLI